MILVVDNYDSFTFNLVQALQAAGAEVHVVRNDVIDIGAVAEMADDPTAELRGIVDLARSGRSGRCRDLGRGGPGRRRARHSRCSGCCLGMQSMAAAFGASIVRAPTLVHGEASEVTHDGDGLLERMPPAFMAARYHSLAIDPATLPPELRVTAMSEVDRVIMGIRHVALPLEGVQFHPESVLTPEGPHLLAELPAPGRRRPGLAARRPDRIVRDRRVGGTGRRGDGHADERDRARRPGHDRRGRDADDGRGPRRDGRGDGRRGDAGPAGGAPRRASGCAARRSTNWPALQPRCANASRASRRPRAHRRRGHGRRRERDVQHLDDGRARRRPLPASRSPSTATGR